MAAVRRRGDEFDSLGVAGPGIFHRPARPRVDVTRPAHRHVGLSRYETAVGTVQHVEEAVLRRLHDDLAQRAVDLDVGEDHVLGSRVVPSFAGRGLVVPNQGAVIRVEGDDGGEVQVVAAAGTADVPVPGRAVADAQIEQVEFGVERHRVPDRAATADFPPLAVPRGRRGLHGLVLERLRRIAGHRPEPPSLIAGLPVIGGDVAAHPVFATAISDDDEVLDDPGRAGDRIRPLSIDGQDFPDHLPRARIQRNQPSIERPDEDASLPHRNAPVHDIATGVLAPLLRHLGVVLPDEFSGPAVVGVHPAPGAGGEHDAVDDDRGRLQAP